MTRPNTIATPFVVAAAAAAALATTATAGIESVTITGGHADARGFIVEAPEAVGKNNFQDLDLRAFDERQGITLVDNLVIGGSTIAAGTTVDAHAIVWDPKNSAVVNADIAFSGTILAVATSRNDLRDTDALFGLPEVDYRDPSLRGLESRDVYSFQDEVLSIDFRASSPGDFVRVFTTSIPTPGVTAALGLAGLAAARRRRS